MNIISIDSSLSCTGLYIIKEQISLSIDTRKISTIDFKYITIYQDLRKILKDYQIDFAFLESYSFGSKSNISSILAEVQGITKLALAEFGIKYIDVPPLTWKKAVFSWIPKKKDRNYVAVINKRLNKKFKNTDECDAYLIALAMYNIYNRRILTKKHEELYIAMHKINDNLFTRK